MGKIFCTLDKRGNEVFRDLENENKLFTIDAYNNGQFDMNNYQWFEMFNSYIFDDNGCDYERKGCFIKENDIVLDIGSNIGVFAHRAEYRGASRVICFEPLTPTYNCLIKNIGSKTEAYKLAVGSEYKFKKFKIDIDFNHIGGGNNNPYNESVPIYEEYVYMIDVNSIFDSLLDKVDFMKIDIEGGEIDLFKSIKDENLNKLRCVSCEFHKIHPNFDEFQDGVWNRMMRLGFNGFILFHGNGYLRTLSFWKDL